MRILLIHPHDIYSPLEPWTTRIVAIANEMMRRGHEVKVIYHIHPSRENGVGPNLGICGKDSDNKGGKFDNQLGISSENQGFVRPQRGFQQYQFETVPISRKISLIQAIKEISPYIWWSDVVHIQKALTYCALPVLYSCFRLHKPLHYDWDDWETAILQAAGGRGLPLFLMRLSEFLMPILSDTVSVSSQLLYKKAKKLGVHPARLDFAPIGVDIDLFRPMPKQGFSFKKKHNMQGKLVVYHGQLEGALGLEILLLAFAKIAPDFPDWNVAVAGDGNKRPLMEKLAEKLGIMERVYFLGSVNHDEIPAFLSSGDLGAAPFEVAPYAWAKSPLKIAENLACGLPLLATGIGEVPKMVGNAGILAPKGDIYAFAKKLKKLMKDSGKREKLSLLARERAESHLSWSKTTDNLLNLYEVAKKRHRALSFGIFIKENLDLMGIMNNKVYTGPRMIQLDPTGECNNDCLACWCRSPLLGKKPEKQPHLPIERVNSLLEQAFDLNVSEIYMAGGGEPFCHPDIWKIIEKIKKLRMFLTINTNFTLVDEEGVQKLIDYQVDWLTVSLWAGSPRIYSLVHPNKGGETFLKIKDNLRLLIRDRIDRPRIKIYNVLFKHNYRDIDNMMDFARQLPADGVEFTLADIIPGHTDSLLLNNDERKWLLDRVLAIAAQEKRRGGGPALIGLDRFIKRLSGDGAEKGDYDKEAIESVPCTIGWTFLRIMPDGAVNPCLKAHRYPIGNIFEKSLKEIWLSESQKKFRKACTNREKYRNFFKIIGNDPDSQFGCFRGCDDIARNQDIERRMVEIGDMGRKLLGLMGKYFISSLDDAKIFR